MNKLNPGLKKLMAIANKVERSSEREIEPMGPVDVVWRVLRGSKGAPNISEPSLLEFMVQRAAAIAAVVGVLALTVQMSAGGPFIGIWHNAMSQSVVLLRVFLP